MQLLRLLTLASLLSTFSNVCASGFWDTFITDGATRSDNLSLPLRIDITGPWYGPYVDCLYPASDSPFASEACYINRPNNMAPSLWDEYDSLNFKCFEGCQAASGNHWLIIHNLEPAFIDGGTDGSSGESSATNPNPNSGPPGLSEPVKGFGQTNSIFRALVQKFQQGGQTRKRIKLTVDTRRINGQPRTEHGVDAIPFLTFGADSRDGNGGPIVTLTTGPGASQKIGMDIRKGLHEAAEDCQIPGADPQTCEDVSYVSINVQFFADFNGVVYMVQIPLFEYPYTLYDPPLQERNWNWPYLDSVYYPGAKLVYAAPSHLNNCNISIPTFDGSNWQRISYEFPIDDIFQCLASSDGGNAIPDFTSAHLLGAYVVNETAGIGAYLRMSTQNWHIH